MPSTPCAIPCGCRITPVLSEEITLFKSLGLAAEDVACAHYIYQKLLKQNEGVWVEFGALKSE
jgi:hypothetical protein